MVHIYSGDVLLVGYFGSARLGSKGGQGNMETNEPEYKSNSGDVKMVRFIFTREM